MVEEQVRDIVTGAVGAARVRALRYYHVCCWQGRIQCLRAGHTTRPHPVFLGAAGEVFTDGLSPQQWRVLTNRILYICRMTGLTLKDLSAPSQDAPAESRLPKPQVTDLDCKRLQILLAIARATQPDTAALLEHLQQLLETAEVVPAQDVGPDVVTMNSQALVWDEDTAGPMSLALVFPADACGSDIHRVRLSVLSQIGLALLGRRVGDVVEGAIRIDRLLYQPEAAGDFHL